VPVSMLRVRWKRSLVLSKCKQRGGATAATMDASSRSDVAQPCSPGVFGCKFVGAAPLTPPLLRAQPTQEQTGRALFRYVIAVYTSPGRRRGRQRAGAAAAARPLLTFDNGTLGYVNTRSIKARVAAACSVEAWAAWDKRL
jgi:hypothetical protein